MKKPKGQIFLMSILILSVVLTAGMVLMAIFIRDLKQSTETSASVKAFYAADSAMEWQLYNTFNDPDITEPQMANDSQIVSYQNNFNSVTGTGNIKTIGLSGKAKRGIEINF